MSESDSQWYYRGAKQLVFLVEQGMNPEHKLLDIGCGETLRGGVHFTKYLHPGNYFAVDKEDLTEARRLAPTETFVQTGDFAFPQQRYDFAWAQSVFTHLPKKRIAECLKKLRPLLKGKFFATFNCASIDKLGPTHPTRDGEYRRTVYRADTMFALAKRTGYQARWLGDWKHWSGQHMLMFW